MQLVASFRRRRNPPFASVGQPSRDSSSLRSVGYAPLRERNDIAVDYFLKIHHHPVEKSLLYITYSDNNWMFSDSGIASANFLSAVMSGTDSRCARAR